MTNKESYAQLCQSEKSIPIFLQDWWMDAVCAGKAWDVLLSRDDQGQIRAAMPYQLTTRWRVFRSIQMPAMTQIGGIWVRPGLDRTQMGQVVEQIQQTLRDMKLSYYSQHYPIASPMPELMEHAGFKLRKRITYRIEDVTHLEKVMDAFSKNKKRQLQKALVLHADFDLTAEQFYTFHRQCMEQQGKTLLYTREFFLVLEKKCQKHHCGKIIAIRDAEGQLHAVAFIVWDAQSVYYLIPCFTPLHKDSGAGALLVWEAIKWTRELGLAFDFEGSMIRSVANHYRQFGSKPVPYYAVEYSYRKWSHLVLLAQRIKARIVYHT